MEAGRGCSQTESMFLDFAAPLFTRYRWMHGTLTLVGRRKLRSAKSSSSRSVENMLFSCGGGCFKESNRKLSHTCIEGKVCCCSCCQHYGDRIIGGTAAAVWQSPETLPKAASGSPRHFRALLWCLWARYQSPECSGHLPRTSYSLRHLSFSNYSRVRSCNLCVINREKDTSCV